MNSVNSKINTPICAFFNGESTFVPFTDPFFLGGGGCLVSVVVLLALQVSSA